MDEAQSIIDVNRTKKQTQRHKGNFFIREMECVEWQKASGDLC